MPAVLDVKYIVARSERKTVVIFVELDECVTVKAPERASDQRLQRLVARKLPWIYRALAKWTEPLSARARLRGNVLLFGQPCRLDISPDAAEPLGLIGDRFLHPVRGGRMNYYVPSIGRQGTSACRRSSLSMAGPWV